jgi:hypothetical protein
MGEVRDMFAGLE